jgi:hypothetical protein
VCGSIIFISTTESQYKIATPVPKPKGKRAMDEFLEEIKRYPIGYKDVDITNPTR